MQFRTKRILNHFFLFTMLCNNMAMSIYTPLVFAETKKIGAYKIVDGQLILPEVKTQDQDSGSVLEGAEAHSKTRNKAQWDGALLIKDFALPTVNEDEHADGTPQGEEIYTDSTKTTLKNQLYLQDLVSDYSESDKEAFHDRLTTYQGTPNLIQDDAVNEKDLVETYRDVNCAALTDPQEQTDCERVRVAQLFDGMRANEGKSAFLGAVDPIISASEGFIDGDHPYVTEMFNDECMEITRSEESTEHVLTREVACSAASNEVEDLEIEVERFIHSTFIETKTLMEYANSGTGYQILRVGTGDEIRLNKSVNRAFKDGDIEWGTVGSDGAVTSLNEQAYYTVETCEMDDNGSITADPTATAEGCIYVEMSSTYKYTRDTATTDIQLRNTGIEIEFEAGVSITDVEILEVSEVPQMFYGLHDQASIDEVSGATTTDIPWSRLYMQYRTAGVSLLPNQPSGVTEVTSYNEACETLEVDSIGVFTVLDLPEECNRYEMDPAGGGLYPTEFVSRYDTGKIIPARNQVDSYFGRIYAELFGRVVEDGEEIGGLDSFGSNIFSVNFLVPELIQDSWSDYYSQFPAALTNDMSKFASIGGPAAPYEQVMRTNLRFKVHLSSCQLKSAPLCDLPATLGVFDVKNDTCGYVSFEDAYTHCPNGAVETHPTALSTECRIDSYPSFCPTGMEKRADEHGMYYCYADADACSSEYARSIVSVPSIDDSSQYPKHGSVDFEGITVPVDVNVWDIVAYPVNEYFPANLRVEGEAVTGFNVISVGTPENKYTYQLEVQLSEPGPFQVNADLYHIDEVGFRTKAGTPQTEAALGYFLANSYPADAECSIDLSSYEGAFAIDNDIMISNATSGYLNFMPGWGPNGNPPLAKSCWEAKVLVKMGFGSATDKEVECQGLNGDAYTQCLEGKWCTYDDINGQTVCFDTSEGLVSGFEATCAPYINDDTCTYAPERSYCETYSIDEFGNQICETEVHIFDCEIPDSAYSMPSGESSSIVCGGPIECVGGECTNIEDERNTAFGKAATQGQLINEFADSESCDLSTGDTDASCTLFEGTEQSCSRPLLHATTNCCNADDVGLGNVNWVDYYNATMLIKDSMEGSEAAAWMSQQWTGLTDYIADSQVGEAAGSITDYIANGYDAAESYLSEAIQSGADSFYKTIGIDAASAVEDAVIDEIGDQAATQATVEASNQMIESGQAITQQESIFSGVYQWIADGIYDAVSYFSPELANSIFSTATDEAGNQAVNGFANETLNTTLEFLGDVYFYYSMYKLIVGFVYACGEDDIKTTLKIQTLTANYVRTKCKDRLLGKCIAKEQFYCTYSSPYTAFLAREIGEQMAERSGKTEAEYWTENSCAGFSLADLEVVDWDRIDEDEFINLVMQKMQFDPNNMPEDYVPSAINGGFDTTYNEYADGPQAGIGAIESNINVVTITAQAAERVRTNAPEMPSVGSNPDYLTWYQQPEAVADLCELVCPDGYVLRSSTGLCDKKEVTEVTGTLSCDTANGFAYDADEGRCVKYTTTELLTGCASGFTYNVVDDTCERSGVNVVPYDTSCPVGHILNTENNKCEQTTTVRANVDCTYLGDGFALIDGICVNTGVLESAPIIDCPVNHNYIDGECVYEDRQSYQIKCPVGQVYDADTGQCSFVSEVSHPSSVSCPDTYTYSYIDKYCYKTVSEPATLVCDTDNGWHYENGQCQKAVTESIAVIDVCPDGSEFNSDTDQCEIRALESTVTPSCPTPTDGLGDYTLSSGNYCYREVVKTEIPELECRSGFEVDGTECVRIVTQPLLLTCDTVGGYVLDTNTNLCVLESQVTEPATPSCPEGTLVDDECHILASESTVPQCPEQYRYNEALDICEFKKVEEFAPVVTCPDGYSASGAYCYKTYEVDSVLVCPTGTGALNPESGMCEQDGLEVLPVASGCPANFEMSDDGTVCLSTDKIRSTASCAHLGAEYVFNSATNQCSVLQKNYEPAIQRCDPTGAFGELSLCQSPISKVPSYNCPQFYYYDDAQELCVNGTNDFIEPIITCSDPLQWSFDADIGMCTQLQTTDGATCLDGFSFNEALSVCERSVFQDAQFYCQDGYAYMSGQCESTTYHAPTCPDGFTLNSMTDVCESEITVAANKACKPGYTWNAIASACELSTGEVNPYCPDKTSYDSASNECVYTPVSPTVDVCPSGYVYDVTIDACTQQELKLPICPDGSTFNATNDRCEFAAYPTTTLCKVGADSGSNCVLVENKIPNCPATYFYNIDEQKCQREDTVEGVQSCPLSELYPTKLEGGMCIYFSYSEKLSNGDCPIGYFESELDQCVKYEETKLPHYTCPDGYFHPTDDAGEFVYTSPTCLKTPQVDPTCDATYALALGLCQKQHVFDYEVQCTIDGNVVYGEACLSQKYAAPQCPDSERFSPTQSRCVSQLQTAAEPRCEHAFYTYHAGSDTCVGNTTETPVCPENFTLNTHTDTCQEITLSPICPATYTYNAERDECEKWIEEAASFHCEGSSYQTAEGCVFYEPATCETGYSLDTVMDDCRVTNTMPATPFCIDGIEEDVGGNCLPYVSPTCPDGYNFVLANDRCERFETSDIIKVCPDGAVWNGAGECEYRHAPICPDSYAYVPANDRCERLDTDSAGLLCAAGQSYFGDDRCRTTATPTCATGYTFRSDIDACYKSTIIATTKNCYGNTDTGSACFNLSAVSCNPGYAFNTGSQKCEQLVQVEETYSCPAGSVLEGTTCITQQTPTCNTGYTFNVANDRCEQLQTHEEWYTCPSGSRKEGTQCISQATPTCNSGYSFDAGQDRCERLLTHEETYTCASGERLDGNKCREQRTPDCPSGFSFVASNDRCEQLLTHEETYTCPSGSRLDGDQCVAEESPVCTNGYTYVAANDRCEKLLTHEETYTCPSGSRLSGTKCIAQLTPSCGSGYNYIESRDRCEKFETHEETYSCPSGSILSGTKCIAQANPTCNSGYSYVAANDRCEQLLTQEETYTCSAGYRNTGSACVHQQNPSCSSGFTYVASRDRCEKLETAEESYSCNSGYRQIGDQCRQQQSPTCNSGYTFDSTDNRCERNESQSASISCPSGYLDNGTACQGSMQQSDPSCPSGKVMKDGKCTTKTDTNTRACPLSYTLVGNECVFFSDAMENIGACMAYYPDYAWEIYYKSGQPYCRSYTNPTTPICSSGTYNASTGKCESTPTVPYTKSCPDNSWTLSGNTCTRFSTHSPNCNSGFTYSSTYKKCEANSTVDASVSCPSGYSFVESASRCERVVTQVPSCSSGYTYNGAYNMCENNNTVPRNIVCPSGYTFDSAQSRCEKLNTQSPNCPTNYSYNSGTNKCHSNNQTNATVNCNSGYSFNSSQSRCERTLTQSVVCPSSYSYNNSTNKCESNTQTNANIVCNSGYTFNSGQSRCERLVTTAPNCETGFTYNSSTNQCDSNGSYAATPVCNTGYTFDAGQSRCEKFSTAVPICDTGFSYNATYNKCEINNPTNATINCNSGYSFNSGTSRCERTITHAPTCASGYSYNASYNQCEAATKFNATINCNAGYSFNSGNSRCERLNTHTPNCAGGFSYDASANQCEADVAFAATIVCPTAHTFNAATSKCERLLQHSPLCSTGSYDSGYKQCRQNVGYAYECPSDFTKISQSQCQKEENHAPNCPSGHEYSVGNNVCWSTTSWDRVYQCLDAGWQVVGDQCQRLLTDAASCNAGFGLSNDLCRQEVDFIPTCAVDASDPWSVNLDPFRCERTLDTSVLCSAGSYNTTSDRCESPLIDYHYKCPEDLDRNGVPWSLSGTTCHRTTTHEPICDVEYGYVNSADRCELTTPVDFVYFCDDGSWTLDYNTCGKYIFDNAFCLEDYGHIDDRCRPRATTEQVNSCDGDFYLSSEVCRFTERAPVLCATGDDGRFNRTLGQCEQVATHGSSFQCPSDWTHNGSVDMADACSITATQDVSVVCPASYTFNELTLSCERTDYESRVNICPDGYELFEDGRTCILATTDTQPVESVSCPYAGYSLVDGQCVVDEDSNATFFCEDASRTMILNPGSAVTGYDETYVCEATVYDHQTPQYSCDEAGYTVMPDTPMLCRSDATESLVHRCLDGYDYNATENRCEKAIVESVQPDVICPEGYELTAGACIYYEKVVGTLSCENSSASLVDGVCYEEILIDSVAPTQGCARGEENAMGQCDLYTIVDPVYSCDADKELELITKTCIDRNVDYQVADSSCHEYLGFYEVDGQCEQETRYDLEPQCPSSLWSINADGNCQLSFQDTVVANLCDSLHSQVGDKCYSVTTASFVSGCPRGYQLSSDETACERDGVDYIAPVSLCDDGFIAAGDRCVQELKTPGSFYCSNSDWVLLGSTCYEDVLTTQDSAFEACPDGYINTGTDCYINLTTTAQLSCEPGYDYDSASELCLKDEVVQELPQVNCPEGTTQSGTTYCETVSSSVDPTVTCAGTVNAETSQCEIFYEESAPSGYCSAPYVRDGNTCTNKLTERPSLSCPADSTKTGNQCLVETYDSQMPTEVCKDD